LLKGDIITLLPQRRSRDSADPAWGMDPAEYDRAARSPERNVFKLWG